MIDSTLFMKAVPTPSNSALTYAVGDIVPLDLHTGPIAVRQGYGKPVLKKITTMTMAKSVSGSVTPAQFEFVVQNSNWIDPIINGPNNSTSMGALLDNSTGVQSGHECELEVNSTWNVYARCVVAGSYVAGGPGEQFACLIDIDYPQVAAVENPNTQIGIPCSLKTTMGTFGPTYYGGTGSWTIVNIDNLKPGFKYLKTKLSVNASAGSTATGFMIFRNGAYMQGLSQIIPFTTTATFLSMPLDYSVQEQKGPVDYGIMLWSSVNTSQTINVIIDYVKKAI